MARRVDELNDGDLRVITAILFLLERNRQIPTMDEMSAFIGVTRQAIGERFRRMAERGMMPQRPWHFTRWFQLTDRGEEAYARLSGGYETACIKYGFQAPPD